MTGPNTAADAAAAASSCLAKGPADGVFTPTRASSAPSQTGTSSRASGNSDASSAPAQSSGAASMARNVFGSSWFGGIVALTGVSLGAAVVL